MNAEQTTGRVWNRRRTEKQRRLAEANMPGKVIPTDQLVSVLENLLAPGDRVVLEGNNQKQADFLSRMLAEVNPQKIHDLHMIMPSVGRSEHLDLFEKGIARKLDFSFSGTQSLRISQLLEDGLLEIGAIHTYIELYSRLYVDLSPNVALIAGYKADRKGNLYTGPSTEDTPALVESRRLPRRHCDSPGQRTGGRRMRSAARRYSRLVDRLRGGCRQAVLYRTALHPRSAPD